MTNTLYTGNNLDILPTLPDNSVDAIVTDPPYGLSFMGKKRDYDVPSQKLWEECLRVLKPGGYLLAFAGTRTQHRMAVRIEDAGFEIRDMIAWVYGSGFPKSLNIGKAVDKLQGNEREETHKETKADSTYHTQNVGETIKNTSTYSVTKGTSEWEGWGTALKPALEPITMARKPLSENTVAENVLKWGVGGINIDESRVGTDIVKTTAHKTLGDGIKYGKSKPFGESEERTGRFPANLIHDGSDEVVELFPGEGDKSASRFFYAPKASKSERNMGCEDIPIKDPDHRSDTGKGSYVDKGIAPQSNSHPTVKPIALMEYLVKLVSKEGAIVLDPFAGSGSTLIACKKLDRKYIGIEMTEEYIPIIEARLNATVKEEPEEKQPSLF